jgi:hypothetical protein
MILGGVATSLGSATQDGEINVSITEDPIITLANVSVSSGDSKDNSLEAARIAREKAVADARAEILRAIKEGKAITLKQFNAAEIFGATEKSISQINVEIKNLSQKEKEVITSVEKIVFKFKTIDRVARGERVYFSDLQTIGLIKPDSRHKSSISVALGKAATAQVDTFEKIEAFVASVEKKFSDRKSGLVALIARIKDLIK